MICGPSLVGVQQGVYPDNAVSFLIRHCCSVRHCRHRHLSIRSRLAVLTYDVPEEPALLRIIVIVLFALFVSCESYNT